MKFGVVIGRFQAPIIIGGHRTILQAAAKDNDELIIFIADNEIPFSHSNIIPYEIREALLADFIKSSINKTVHFYKLDDQKYASYIQAAIDHVLAVHYDVGKTNEATLYGGPGNFAERYSGIMKVKLIEKVNLGPSAEQARSVAYNHMNYSATFCSGIIKAIRQREPICHNYVISVAIGDNGRENQILVEQNERMKRLILPTFEVVKRFDNLIHQSFAELRDIVPNIVLSTGTQMGSVRVDDWRFRDSDDFCYYHMVYHRVHNNPDAPLGYRWLTKPIGAYQFEVEYHQLLPYINQVL